ncbi:TonB-dependent receptor domain-containing protein [Pedobacter nototheniae]|uniref:TonB-dependent receptor domain-containing protein n=1 Tax=Pedobacter nototheniae TaxID=2488994 RepID=UPI00292FBCC2|nr:TonB-dependent receptor [Pedobacter nototheniae]
MKKIITSVIYLAFIISGRAMAQTQNTMGKIAGTVTEKSGAFIPATIVLKKAKDSILVRVVEANDKGYFSFDQLNPGNYSIEINLIGYKKIRETIALDGLPISKNYVLETDITQLGEVNVSGKKPLIERFSDKTVLNIENSIVATGNSALEILAKAPGVSIDQNEQISLKGKAGVNVLIDGKPTYLSAEQLATRLKSLSSTSIKSIELITSPSAQYDAQGNAGIINIKLKKNANFGTNGSIDAGYGYGKYAKNDAGISLNHRSRNLNIFGSYNYNYAKNNEDLDIFRLNDNGTQQTYFHQNNNQVRTSYNNNYKFGVDYSLNDKNTLGFLTTGYFNNGHDSSIGNTIIGNSAIQADSVILANNPSTNKYRNQAYNLNYKALIDTLGQQFSTDIDYVEYRNLENTTYNNLFMDNNGLSYKNPLIFRNTTPAFIKIWSAKVDYAVPITPKTKLEVGLKSSKVNTDNDFKFENLINNNWQNDESRSNRFIYSEQINAAYASLKHDFKSTNIQIGLRVEQTNSKGNSINDQKVIKRNYIDFFPNLSINQTLSENHEIGFNYNRRIDRPDYRSLNPFVYFVDLYTFSQGNPFLNPQYTNNFQFSYTYNKSLNISFSYGITSDLITDVLLADREKKTLFQTSQNLAKQRTYDLTIGYPTQITKFWSMDNNLTNYYNQIISADLNGTGYNGKKLSFMLNSNHSFKINASTNAELSASYISPQIYGTYAIKPYYGIDMGLKKSFLNNKLNIKLAANDIFNTRKARVSSAVSDLNYSLNQKQETRTIKASINYIFGSSQIKGTRERKTGAAEEESRIKK